MLLSNEALHHPQAEPTRPPTDQVCCSANCEPEHLGNLAQSSSDIFMPAKIIMANATGCNLVKIEGCYVW
jgi:hypothetical protein